MSGIFDDDVSIGEKRREAASARGGCSVADTALRGASAQAQKSTPTASVSIGMQMLLQMGKGSSKPMMVEKPPVARATGGFAQTGNSHVEPGTVDVGSVLVKLPDDKLNIRLGGRRGLQGADAAQGGDKIVLVAESAADLKKDVEETLRSVRPLLCVVTRVGSSGTEFEVEFADKHREKLTSDLVRHAGALEKAEFDKTATSEFALALKAQKKEESKAAAASASVGAGRVAAAAPWQVRPGLLMRVVSERPEMREMLGEKCRIESVSAKEGSARALLMQQPQRHDEHSRDAADAPPALPRFFTVYRGDVDTVVPRVGKGGVALVGPHAGRQVVVVGRDRDANGDVSNVRVKLCEGSGPVGEAFELAPEDVCCIAPR